MSDLTDKQITDIITSNYFDLARLYPGELEALIKTIRSCIKASQPVLAADLALIDYEVGTLIHAVRHKGTENRRDAEKAFKRINSALTSQSGQVSGDVVSAGLAKIAKNVRDSGIHLVNALDVNDLGKIATTRADLLNAVLDYDTFKHNTERNAIPSQPCTTAQDRTLPELPEGYVAVPEKLPQKTIDYIHAQRVKMESVGQKMWLSTIWDMAVYLEKLDEKRMGLISKITDKGNKCGA